MSDPDSTPMTVSMRGFLVLAVMEAAPLSMHDALKVVDAVLTRLERPTPGMFDASLGPEMRDENDIICYETLPSSRSFVLMIRAARSGK